MYGVVARGFVSEKLDHESRELLHVWQQLLLGQLPCWPRRYIDDPRSLELRDQRQQRPVAACEDIDLMSLSGKLTRHIRHVDILSATVDAAGNSERRRMFADECDLHDGVPGEGLGLEQVAPAEAWAAGPDTAFVVPLVKRTKEALVRCDTYAFILRAFPLGFHLGCVVW